MFQLFSFLLLRASGGCVRLNISRATRLFERLFVTNGVTVAMMEGKKGDGRR